jgi:predicted molibdopterin-dependent oxidoreductase YjgC
MAGRIVRLAETKRRKLKFVVDGRIVEALEGDTLLVAILGTFDHVRVSEFGDGKRAGFCFMGACQDCWVWTADGGRLRACSTIVTEGMAINTKQPEASWSDLH